MRERLLGAITVGCLLVLGACSDDPTVAPSTTAEPAPTEPPPPTTDAPETTEETTTTTSTTTTTTVAASTTTTASPTTTTVAPETTTTTTVAPPAEAVAAVVPEPAPCVHQIQPGDSLSAIVAGVADAAVTVEAVALENGLGNANSINAGNSLDLCVGNGIDDITGQPRALRRRPWRRRSSIRPSPPPAGTGVAAQQQKLNALFAGYGLAPLDVDGASGRLTEQQLCAARVALGLPASRADMEPGGPEEQMLMGATSLPIPAAAPVTGGPLGAHRPDLSGHVRGRGQRPAGVRVPHVDR